MHISVYIVNFTSHDSSYNDCNIRGSCRSNFIVIKSCRDNGRKAKYYGINIYWKNWETAAIYAPIVETGMQLEEQSFLS